MKNAILRRGKLAWILITVILVGSISTVVHATTTQEKLDNALKDKDKIQQQIDQNKEELNDLRKTESGLQKELNNLTTQLREIGERLEELTKQIADKEAEIAATEEELAAARQTEQWQYECMVERIQYLYEEGQMGYLELLFSTNNFSDLLNYEEYISAIVEYDRNMLTEYETVRMLVEEEEVRLQREKAELDQLKVDAEAEKSKVAGLVSQTSHNLDLYGDQIDQAEAEALAYEEELRKKEADIEALKKQIEEEKRKSQEALNATWRDISDVVFTEYDRKMIANIIYCEAGGEPYEGKLAVGAVVINRLLSSKYPDTVEGVITQPYQFSPVRSGRFALAMAQDKANAACYRAADEAMSGMTNVGSCLYFRTPIEGLTGIRIGGHIFY